MSPREMKLEGKFWIQDGGPFGRVGPVLVHESADKMNVLVVATVHRDLNVQHLIDNAETA